MSQQKYWWLLAPPAMLGPLRLALGLGMQPWIHAKPNTVGGMALLLSGLIGFWQVHRRAAALARRK